MEENQKKEKSLIFWLALLVALVVGVIGIFAMLEMAVPDGAAKGSGGWNALLSKDGAPTAYSVRTMGSKDRDSEEIGRWMTSCGDYIAQELDGESRDTAFWLWRQEDDEYVLYLPEQDRTLTSADITANEEKDDDGSKRLVLRIRTPEEGEQVAPDEQLLCFATTSETWNGVRLTVVLDGREQTVRAMMVQGDNLYTSEQAYMGRN